jgi:hypothetical protein
VHTSVPYKTLLYWLLLAGVILFGTYLAWDLGVLRRIIAQDSTRITIIILLVLAGGSLHCAWRSWYLARQRLVVDRLRSGCGDYPASLAAAANPGETSVAVDYLIALESGDPERDNTQLAEVMAETVRGSHQVGWFLAGLVIKLGLLGTVIGFVLMLGSVSGLDALDIGDIKQLIQQMTRGMGIAMNTTMIGLVSSILLGLQYLLLDRSADHFVADTVMLGQGRQNRADETTPAVAD